MYTFLVILIIIASILLVLSVLAQSPKSGMAANFGASNQVMGVRQTANFLEKASWYLAIAIVVLSLLSTVAMSSYKKAGVPSGDAIIEQVMESAEQAPVMPNQVDAEVTVEE
ncbi:MAG: preprotein translocase subunit SecG [Tidjanibacter sp.]|jgi:preprotein translocase subunit SecG|nr:preprotein translocase subunit SecG [Tidjanibacter sp.]